jgi:flagellar motor switch protein FliN/FliY
MGDMRNRLTAFVEELAAAIAPPGSGAVQASPGAMPRGRAWTATLTASGDPAGQCIVVIDHAGASGLSRLVSARTGDVEDAAVADLLRKLLTQAAAGAAGRPAETRLELTLSAVEPRDTEAGAPAGDVTALAVPGLPEPLAVAIGWIAAPAAAVFAARPSPDEALGDRIDVILDIDLPVVVRFGRTELPIRALSRIGPGSVIDLGRSPDDPVEVLVSNRVVARGEVVIVGGNYGVRILDVASQNERARTMEA